MIKIFFRNKKGIVPNVVKNLYCGGASWSCSAGCGVSRCSVVAAQSTLFRKKLGKNLLGGLPAVAHASLGVLDREPLSSKASATEDRCKTRHCRTLHPPIENKPCLTVDKSILSWYILYVMENYCI
jgi:hypothetical protein